MSEVNTVVERLALSQKNLQHYAERVDYYGAKLKRQSPPNQQLYLLCYLQSRWQQSLERIADGFVHHVRQAKQKATVYAQKRVYQDWQRAARNVSKAANVLLLFVDEGIDPDQSFGSVKKQAFKLLNANDLDSVCRFLNNQKQSSDEAMWQYFDEHSSLRSGLLRDLFCCLHIEDTDKILRLSSVLNQARLDLIANKALSDAGIDKRLLPKRLRPLFFNKDGTVRRERYEWFLFLQIPSRLNGQLMLPDVIKYRALDDDLLDKHTWKDNKPELLAQTQQPKLSDEPQKLITKMVQEVDTRLHEVSNYLEQTDNRDVILRPKGCKRHWRLPTASKKHLINNPYFQQMRGTSVADVLRLVDRETGFIEDFEHVLGMNSKRCQHEVDLLAILIGNASNQGIYGMAQISDRSYNQLSTIQANYLRLETLNAANDRINNASARLPIFKHYNIQEDVLHASADGQKFDAKRETFRTRYSST